MDLVALRAKAMRVYFEWGAAQVRTPNQWTPEALKAGIDMFVEMIAVLGGGQEDIKRYVQAHQGTAGETTRKMEALLVQDLRDMEASQDAGLMQEAREIEAVLRTLCGKCQAKIAAAGQGVKP